MNYICWARPLNAVCVCVRWHKIPWKASAVIRKQCKTNKYKNWKARGEKCGIENERELSSCAVHECECSRAYTDFCFYLNAYFM